MRFGPVPVQEAAGAILAHSLAVAKGRIRKGRVLDAADVAALAGAGYQRVTVACLETGDVPEDRAAALLGDALVPDGPVQHLRLGKPAHGRINIHAVGPGVLHLDVTAINAANLIDPMITIATLPPLARVDAGRMVATVKIISYAVGQAALGDVVRQATASLAVRPVILKTATLIQTEIGAGDPAKGKAAVKSRLNALGMDLTESVSVGHNAADLARSIADATGDLVLILTASATSDPRDVAPQALLIAGGSVTRFGLPVDPGNLLFLGKLGNKPVIGLPGCARSPALNGADWVLERLVCGIPVGDADMAAMGVGGLLKEIPARGMPRDRDN